MPVKSPQPASMKIESAAVVRNEIERSIFVCARSTHARPRGAIRSRHPNERLRIWRRGLKESPDLLSPFACAHERRVDVVRLARDLKRVRIEVAARRAVFLEHRDHRLADGIR